MQRAARAWRALAINTERALGIGVTQLRRLARDIGRDHGLAQRLWSTGIHEARILASMVDEPSQVTTSQMEGWASDFDSWDLVDQCCGNLFDKTPYAYDKALEWSGRPEEFVKRAGFALMAWLAVHDKPAPDESFEPFLEAVGKEATDERNFVKKAVNWALRQIGKRNGHLNSRAIEKAEKLRSIESRSARWIGRDALRELTSDKVAVRLGSTVEQPNAVDRMKR
jgi:3-methyladenine DNA glycosylase AlkD